MSSLVFDIETDGFDYTKIFCIVAVDVHTNEVFKYGEHDIQEGLELLKAADKLIGHNIIGFDLPAIRKLHNLDLQETCKVLDTLVVSRLFNPTREGGHSIEAWGYKLGYEKIKFDDFSCYTEEMLEYCVRDVLVNLKVYKALCKEAKGFDKRAIELEHSVYNIVNTQRENGFKLNVKYAMELVAILTQQLHSAEDEVHETFKPKIIKTEILPTITNQNKVGKMGIIKGGKKKVRLSDEEYDMAVKNPNDIIIRSDSIPFNLGSRKQIGEYLIEFGWKPTRFTETGQPIVDEKTLEGITKIPEARLIAKYLMLQKRVAQINSWLDVVTKNERVHGVVNTNGAVTGRMTHSKPNMAQIPASYSPYGVECRSCWTVDKGNKLVGIDASGLELRMLAHYMNDKAYTYEIINGDIHTNNQNLAGLESRSQAKTFIYALLYGAGDAKLGTVVGGNQRDGRNLRQRFLNNLPAFANLKDRVGRASTKGWLKGLDGRKLFVRSEHAALNTLLQGAGAIVMKEALVILNDLINMYNLNAKFVANVHDEWQIEASIEHAEEVGRLGVQAIQMAGDSLKLRCPLDGEYNVGNNWSETH